MKTLKNLKAFLLLTGSIAVNAQNQSQTIPSWVKMMDDPKVNYYQAVNEFNNFWKDKVKPEEENEFFNDQKIKKAPEDSDALKYAFEYKKFMHWQREMLVFVKEDGTLLTSEERKTLWEIEKINRTNSK